jgi:uncharacterized protein YfiM (DUF2279 family)
MTVLVTNMYSYLKPIRIFFLLLALSIPCKVFSQFTLSDSIPFQKKKLTNRILLASAVYAVGMVGLNEVWYKTEPREAFHFFNDNQEWKQVDKIGHFYSAFYVSAFSASAINGCGIRSKKSAAFGALTGFAALLTVEIFDGYSAAYGASVGDLLANAAGSSFYWGQQALWKGVRIQPKFSFHSTRFAAQRPNVLGDGLATELLKDYNGQTYWLSVDMDKFVSFPKWLNLAVGYGAEEMIFAQDAQNTTVGFYPYRQYYVSIDFDFRSVRTRSKVLRSLLNIVSIIKFPAPALEFSDRGLRFRPLYF